VVEPWSSEPSFGLHEAKMLSRDEIRLIKETMQQIQLPTPPWAQRLWGSPICSKKDCF